jgi:hypothetical protein
MSEGGFDSPGPVDSGAEKLPVTEETKQRFSTTLETRARAGSFFPAVGSDSFDFYRTEIPSDLNGVPADVLAWWFPNGTQRTPNLRGTVTVEKGDNLGIVRTYNLKQIPDGWDIEGHDGVSKKKISLTEMVEAIKRDGGEEFLRETQEQDKRLQDSKQLERELGIAGVDEDEIKDLITILDSDPVQK